jgi:undecaprenyl-diphosphatase
VSFFHEFDLWLFTHGNLVWVRSWCDPIFLWLTAPPYRVFVFAVLWLSLFILGGRRGRIAAALSLVAVLISDSLCNELLKPWIGRVRPCFALSDVRLLVPRQAHSPSFPSSHAMNSFAVAAVLFGAGRALGWIGIVVAALVSWSRVYVGVHYPSDIAGGALFGFAIGWGVRTVADRLPAWRLRRARPAPEGQAEGHNCRKA